MEIAFVALLVGLAVCTLLMIAWRRAVDRRMASLYARLEQSRRTARRWRFALESAGDCVQDWNLVTDECHFSKGFAGLLGLDVATEVDRATWVRVMGDDWRYVERKIQRHLQGLSDTCHVEYAVHNSQGVVRHVVMRGRVVERTDEGRPARMVSNHRDITIRRRMEDALRDSEERYRKLFELAQEGIWQINPEGVTVLVNEAMATMLGHRVEDVLEQPILDFVAEQDRVRMQKALLGSGAAADAKQYYQFQSKTGQALYTSMHWTPVYGTEGEYEGLIAGVMDITEQRHAEERIRQQALFDDLTRLPNRRMLIQSLNQDHARAQRHGHKGALLCIDLDHFKNVNDSLGHPVGDGLLVSIATRLHQVLRAEDTLARLGGDEFVVLLPELAETEQGAASLARNVALKVQDCMSETLSVFGHRLNIACSIGIALYPQDQESVHDVLKQADVAMYRAKAEGRNAVCLFSKEMHQAIEENLRLQMLLPGALEDEQFILYFQPQFNEHRQVIGAEVLLRWEDPEQGFVRPELFIRAAEESGQIVPLGDWVIRKACWMLGQWKRAGENQCTVPETFKRLAINISARQLAQDDFPYRLQAFVQEAGLAPDEIELEITESMLLNRLDQVVEKMDLLHSMGFHMALDDFGTGYSSLSYLHTLPLDKLKIDQAFVQDIRTDQNDRVIVETIIAMARLMDLEVIAEGVEDEHQFNYLREKGCLRYQGYYFGKPVPADRFAERWLSGPV